MEFFKKDNIISITEGKDLDSCFLKEIVKSLKSGTFEKIKTQKIEGIPSKFKKLILILI